MKKLSAFVLTTMMLFSLTACGSKTANTTETKAPEAVQTEAAKGNGGDTAKAPSTDAPSANAPSANAPSENAPSEDALVLLPGKLEIVNGGNGPVIKGVTVAGNRSGSTEFNSKAPAADDIRCVFELNEYLDFYLDTDEASGLKVLAYEHVDDANAYIEKTPGSDGAKAGCDLNKPEDAADSWGAFYLNPEDAPAGYYDLVFTKDGKTVAMMQVKMFDEGSLEGKTDDELSALMKDF